MQGFEGTAVAKVKQAQLPKVDVCGGTFLDQRRF